MTTTFYEIGLYLLTFTSLFTRPGFSGWTHLTTGFSRAQPWVLGVTIGDFSVLPLSYLTAVHAALSTGLELVAVTIFILTGGGLIIAWVDQLRASDQSTKAGFFWNLSLYHWSM